MILSVDRKKDGARLSHHFFLWRITRLKILLKDLS
jgi:hypothetical protein